MSKVELYDTTLRDGAQGEGISLSVENKLAILEALDHLGVHYVEGGFPGSNPKDVEFFTRAKDLHLKNTTLTAFGATRRPGTKVESDPNLRAFLPLRPPSSPWLGRPGTSMCPGCSRRR